MKQSLLLVSLSVLISLGGCGGGSSSSVTPPPAPPPEEPRAPAPTVTAVEPASGPTTGGTSVTLTGTDFTGATAVRFGANDAASFTVDSATTITAVTPAGDAGTVNVTVTTASGTSGASTTGRFTYVVPEPSAAGLWQGHTDAGQAIGGVVRPRADNGAYWLVYSSAGSTAPDSVIAANAAGFITGVGNENHSTATDGSFASANLREFNFAGNGTAGGSLSAGYTEKAKFGRALTGAGRGTFISNANPTTLSNGEADEHLPPPGSWDLAIDVENEVYVSGDLLGGGPISGTTEPPTGDSLTFTISGRLPIPGLTDTTNTQVFKLQGTFSGGVLTVNSGTMEVTDCIDNSTPPELDGCPYILDPAIGVVTLDTVSGTISAAGGTVTMSYGLLPDFGVVVSSEFTFAGATVTNDPQNPTFTDGDSPWVIETTGGNLALTGTLAFDPYEATVDQGSASAVLTIPSRRITVDDSSGTLTYDSTTDTLRLTGTTLTDVSGEMDCAGSASICGSGTLPSITSQLSGDVVIALGAPAAGQYQAKVFIGGESSPVSTLSFDGTLPLVPSTTVNFTTDYLASYEAAPTLAAVQGTHSGSAGIDSAIQPGASFTIDAAGALTAGVEASGCSYVGSVTPAESGNVYDVALTFTAGESCTYAGPFTGVAFFDENGKLTITATDASRNRGFLFIAQ